MLKRFQDQTFDVIFFVFFQVRMIKLLLEHGADKNLTVEDYRPADLLKVERIQAHAQLRLNSLGGRKQDR